MKIILSINFFTFFLFSSFSQTKPNYTLVFQDEFDKTTMDVTKWQHRQPGVLRNTGYNSTNNAFVKDGKMVITASYDPTTQKYYGGMVSTEKTYLTTYGYFEASMKAPLKQGHWSAFWLQTPTMTDCVNDPATFGVEVDIVEYLRKDFNLIRSTLHWDGYGACHKTKEIAVKVPGCETGYHTYAVEWTPTEYIFYVDNKEIGRTSAAVSKRNEYMILSLEHGPWGGSVVPASCPDSVFFDYVRVYKKNPTSVKNMLKSNITIAPNPAQTTILISIPENEFTNKQLKIYNLAGTIVKETQMQFSNNIVDIQSLQHGVYFVDIPTISGNQIKKLIKN